MNNEIMVTIPLAEYRELVSEVAVAREKEFNLMMQSSRIRDQEQRAVKALRAFQEEMKARVRCVGENEDEIKLLDYFLRIPSDQKENILSLLEKMVNANHSMAATLYNCDVKGEGKNDEEVMLLDYFRQMDEYQRENILNITARIVRRDNDTAQRIEDLKDELEGAGECQG